MGRRKKYTNEEDKKEANRKKALAFYWRNKDAMDKKAKDYYWKTKNGTINPFHPPDIHDEHSDLHHVEETIEKA